MEYNVTSYCSSRISDFQINMKAIRNDYHLSKVDAFKGLLESESYTDVRFICSGGETVTCHGSILASVSPMLKEWMMSYNYNPDKYFSVLLPDVSGKCMKYFIQLLYGSTLVLNVQDHYNLLQSLCQMLNIESKILSRQGVEKQSQANSQQAPSLPLCCWRCGATFSTLYDLKSHVSEKHFGEKIKATKRHRCTKCKKVLPSMWKLRQHLLTHSLNNANVDHQYAEPRRRMPSRRSIDHPYANPSSDHPYSSRSSIEGKRKGILTTRKSQQKAATSLHSYAQERPSSEMEEVIVPPDKQPECTLSSPSDFICPHCSKSFPKKYRLARHVEEVHDQVKKYSCTQETCTKAFFKKTSLTRHALTHVSVPSYSCEHCSKKFKDPSGLKYHVSKGVCLKKD